jgi:hypothetical protein
MCSTTLRRVSVGTMQNETKTYLTKRVLTGQRQDKTLFVANN